MGQNANTKSVAIGVTETQLLPLRAEREVVWIFNSSSSIIYYKFGPGVTTTFYTNRLAANEASPPIYKYSGPITAIRASGTSNVLVTECW